MYCPNCGQFNNGLATRCSACGSTLPQRPVGDDVAQSAVPSASTVNDADTSSVLNATTKSAVGSAGSAESVPPTIELPNADKTAPAATSATETAAEPAEAPDPAPEEPTEEHTATREPVSSEAPSPSDAAPEFHEVRETAGRYVSAKRNRFLEFLGRHQVALGLGIAVVVVAVLGVVWLVSSITNGPAANQIEADLAALAPNYSYAGGTYGPDLEIPLSRVNVTRREPTQTPADVTPAEGVGPGMFQVDADLVYDDGKLQVTHSVSGLFVRSDEGWTLTGELADQGTSLTAQAGVDETKVLNDIHTILSAASVGKGKDRINLDEVYEDGSFSVVGHSFEPAPEKDTATDDVVIRCERESGFSAYRGNVTAHFAFESGAWRLRSAEADQSAITRTYDQLLGTWTGSMVAQDADGGSCFGAKNVPVSITITSVGNPSQGGGQVQGTISCLAHYHERLKSDQSSNASDAQVENLAFWGTISSEYDKETGSDLNIACSSAGEPRGKISFVLSFGTSDDPSAAFARVTTMHDYEEYVLFVMPRQTTARFTDTYVLSRAS